ncbi:hypothetical protein PVAND_003316 [Polypedilum vanderplanki]|uniref:Metalloendopeptidase n=1 Tax=Polypedilum vanderplanki TaxID=319348 RepID=A0A9J6BUN5_POLVA|nr:hypothetical protein PVAND_003316 [Polypedilum vanderplanki]
MKFLITQTVLFCTFSLLYAAPVDEAPVEEVIEGEGEDNGVGEYGEHYQGDIILTPEQEEELANDGRDSKTGILNTNARWPKVNGYVQVPYVITGFSSGDISKIRTGMNDIESKTCVRFIARSNQANFIRIISGSGCYSYIGRIGGQQDVSLQSSGCLSHGTIMHELIHALGYDHMQNHYQRDTLVRINWENIQDGRSYNFNKVNPNTFGDFGTSYDLDSVMHYGGYSFSKNGRLTIQTLNSGNQGRIGQRTRLSDGDIARIKNMYGC